MTALKAAAVMSLKGLRDRRAELHEEGCEIVLAYQSEKRDPTAAEDEKLAELTSAVTELDEQISAAEQRADAERKFSIEPGVGAGGVDRARDVDPEHGFSHIGEFLACVVNASRSGGSVADSRLHAAPTNPAIEGAGEPGGYMVPPQYSTNIRSHSLEGDAILPLTDSDQLTGNSMKFPADETTPWGTNGVRAYWEAEAHQAQQTRPVLEMVELRLNKLIALVPMSEELLEDAPTMGPYVERKAGESIRWKTNDSFINGLGAGLPLGYVNSPSLVVQAPESGQATATVNATNVAKMFARNLNPGRAVWMVSPSIYDQLVVMTIGNHPVFVPASAGIQQTPGGFLLGRPIMMSDSMQAAGNQHDISFVDWGSYHTATKRGAAVTSAMSMHLWFDFAVNAFRVIFRVDGQPWARKPVEPPNTPALTRSAFVTLAARP